MYKDINFLNKDVEDTRAINNSIRNILMTRRGSVPGRPRFGSDLYKLLFTQMNGTIKGVAESMIFQALTEFEDRISIININVKSVDEYNKVVCNITYKYKNEFNTVEEKVNISLA